MEVSILAMERKESTPECGARFEHNNQGEGHAKK
jgi:hypothetical protein